MKPSDPSQHQSFASLEAGIEAGAALLKRGYISQGLTTPAAIGRKWAPPGAANDPNRTNAMWPGLVAKEMARLKAETAAAGGSGVSLGNGDQGNEPQAKGKRRNRWEGIAMNPINNITVNGVAPGREALMAKKTALAMRDPLAEGLRQIRGTACGRLSD